MKRVLVLAVVAFAGVLAAGSAAQADHYRDVGHHGGGCGSGGYPSNYGGYGGGYGVPSYGYGGGYAVPIYGYGVPSYGYGVPSHGHGGGYRSHGGGYGSGFSVRTQGLRFHYHR